MLQAFQARLQETGYFSGVEVSADMSAAHQRREYRADLTEEQKGAPPKPPAAGQPVTILPVLVRVTENKQQERLEAGVGYSTNTGATARQLSLRRPERVFGLRMKSNLIFESEAPERTRRLLLIRPRRKAITTASAPASSARISKARRTERGHRFRRAAQWGTPLLERSLTLEYC